ncbi:hypothetical protein [Chitinophaga sp. ARDCPP14]|uniref:hypothetical protein n=1 Tax=Chitinophaga sp. ARDCPP14 TaxID=3391139 RepID=UPI003F51D041
MNKALSILSQKEGAIIAAFDELAVIHTTGKSSIPILQSVLMALYGYPSPDLETKSIPDVIIADNIIRMTIGILERCIKGRMPQNAIYSTGQLLGIALEYTQTAISKQTANH